MKQGQYNLVIYSFICSMVIFVAYEISLERKWLEGGQHAINQFSSNIIKAESILYEKDRINIVVVGTSLTNRIRQAWLPKDSIAFGMSGASTQDGLAVLLRSGLSPKYVFVEMNVIERGGSQRSTSLRKSILNDTLMPLRRNFLEFREKNRPSTYLIKRLAISYYSTFRNPRHGEAPESKNKHVSVSNEKLKMRVAKNIKRHYDMFSRVKEKALMAKMNELMNLVNEIERRGSTVILYETPMHPALCNSDKMKMTRRLAASVFPGHVYLRARDCSKYRTTDGMHLSKRSAYLYTRQLLKVLPVGNSVQYQH